MVAMMRVKIIFILASALFFASCAKNLRCNLYVIDEMDKKNIYVPHKDANYIDSYLKKSKKWKMLARTAKGRLNHAKAYGFAKAGKTVIVSYNAGPGCNGHVAIVDGTKQMIWSPKFGASVPYASGSVRGRDPESLPLSRQFSADKEPAMNYFVYDNNN